MYMNLIIWTYRYINILKCQKYLINNIYMYNVSSSFCPTVCLSIILLTPYLLITFLSCGSRHAYEIWHIDTYSVIIVIDQVQF